LKSLRLILIPGLMYGFLAAVVSAGALLLYVSWYGSTDRFAPGVHLGTAPVGGLRLREGWLLFQESSRDSAPVIGGMSYANQRAGITLRWKGHTWDLPSGETVVVLDSQAALQEGLEIGRRGSILDRMLAIAHGWIRGHHLLVEPTVDKRPIEQHLGLIAQEVDQPQRDAVLDVSTGAVTLERVGYQLDLEASIDLVRSAILSGQNQADLVVREISPALTRQALAAMQRQELARFHRPCITQFC